MPRIIETTVYQFDELPTDAAKEKARDWWRALLFSDSNEWDYVYEDAETIATLMGITIRHRTYKTVGGKEGTEPCIFFSGFASQGDGASFQGSYTFKADAVEAVKGHAPIDGTLHIIVQRLMDAQALVQNNLSASITTRGNYSHSGTMEFDFDYGEADESIDAGVSRAEREVTQALRNFADWIYAQLRKEYEWQSENAQIDEALRSNEYEFTVAGKRA